MTVAILLAAGAGKRFGGGKLLAPLHGKPLVLHALTTLQAARLPVIAVVRPDDGALATVLTDAGARVSPCARAIDGMGFSLAHGATLVEPGSSVVVALGDMPAIASRTVCRLVEALDRGAAIALPVSAGHRGHPVAFGAQFVTSLRSLVGDTGARDLLARHADVIEEIVIDDPGILLDVDTRDALEGLDGSPPARSDA